MMESSDYSSEDASPRCSFCGRPLKEGAVLCLECGFHHELGYHVAFAKWGQTAERKQRGPIRVIALALAAVAVLSPLVLSGVLYFFQEQLIKTEFYGVGVRVVRYSIPVLSLLSAAAVVVAYVWLLTIAFASDVVQGILGLLCGLYLVFYGMAFAQKEASPPLYLLAAGFVLGLLSYAMTFIVPHLV